MTQNNLFIVSGLNRHLWPKSVTRVTDSSASNLPGRVRGARMGKVEERAPFQNSLGETKETTGKPVTTAGSKA